MHDEGEGCATRLVTYEIDGDREQDSAQVSKRNALAKIWYLQEIIYTCYPLVTESAFESFGKSEQSRE